MKQFQPAGRLGSIPEYVFSRLAKATAGVERQSGRPVLNLGVGTPDVPPSSRYSQKLAELVSAPGAHAYPGYGATAEFAKALREWYNQRFGVDLSESALLPLNGSKDGIAHLPLAILDEDDEVLVPDPGYPPFSEPAWLVGAKTVTYDLTQANDFKPDLQDLEAKTTERTRYLWLNFPSNPTGQVMSLDELRPLVDFARSHCIFILYDNAYSEITYGGFKAPSILQIDGAQDIAVELGSFSKSHSFAGWRMGWIVGNPDIVSALAKVKTQMDSGMALPLQGLAAYALTQPDAEWQAGMLADYQRRRDIIAKHLRDLGLTFELPKGSLYIWAKIPDQAKDSESFCLDLLETKQILITPGSAFGKNGERYVRVSFSSNVDKIEEYF